MRQGQGKSRGHIPRLWLMTDERIAPDELLRAVARLPRGAAVVVRHYRLAAAGRRALFQAVRRIGGRRGLVVLLAGDAAQARDWRADGHHGPGRAPRAKSWLHSAAVHDHRELVAARRAGADVVLISPLFATRSHPGAQPLRAARFAALARRSSAPVIALGGMRRRHAVLARRLGACGIAAIDGLVARR